MKSGLKVFVLVFFTLLGLGAGLLLFRLDLLVLTVANSYLERSGFSVKDLQALTLDSSSAHADKLILAGNGVLISLSDLQLTYKLSELIPGQVDAVTIGRLAIVIDSSEFESTSQDGSLSLTAMLNTVDQLPISAFAINELLLQLGDRQVNVQLDFASNPASVAATAFIADYPDFKVDFSAIRSDSNNINGTIIVYSAGELVVRSELDLNVLAQDVKIAANTSFHLDAMRNFAVFEAFKLSTLSAADTLQTSSELSLRSPFQNPAVTELTITLDNPDSQLLLTPPASGAGSELRLQLPLQLAGHWLPDTSGLELSTAALEFSGSWEDEDNAVRAQSKFTNVSINCTSMTACSATSEWNSEATSWKFGEIFGQQLGLSGSVNFNYANSELRASAAALELAVPSIQAAEIDASATVLIEDLQLRLGYSFDLSFDFSSRQFDPGVNLLAFQQASASGRFELEDGVLTTVIAVDLNEELQLGAGIQHYFYRNSGDVEIKLAPYNFTSTTPLSVLLEQTPVQGNIVAGSISAQGNFSWSQQSDQSWQVGGPLRFNLQNISGIYEDIFFVDLNTELNAELTTAPGLRSLGPQRATIASLDVGLPVTNIDWQYSFDTVARQFSIIDASSELLGGNIVIPEFDYSAESDHSEMAVVISNLDLASIVKLADYPGLTVDGLISGYLPLQIHDNQILIEAGLVGALKPGGTIQYTPSNQAPSTNPSLQLVNDTLSNYRFQSMNTDVFYDENGDLRLAVQLQGRNPDMNNGQAINLNVNITDNIPTLIRSLQASRIITEALEESLGNR
jgi:hypothetical protein